MFARPQERIGGTAPSDTKRPVEMYVEVEDVEAYHDELRRRCVRITSPLTLQWWGDRTFKIQDPYGYELWFYQTVAEPKPPQGAKIV